MVQYAPLIVGALLAALAWAALRRALQTARLIAHLNRIQPQTIESLATGLQQVRGQITTTLPMQSPLAGRPCVYYFFRIQAPHPKGGWRVIATGKRWTDVGIQDDTGGAEIRGQSALVASPRRIDHHLGPLKDIPTQWAELFDQAGIDAKHLDRFDDLRAHEYTLEPGDDVYVTGHVRTENQAKVFYRAKRSPLIVSSQPDIGYVRGLRHEWLLFSAVAPMLAAAAAILFTLAFL